MLLAWRRSSPFPLRTLFRRREYWAHSNDDDNDDDDILKEDSSVVEIVRNESEKGIITGRDGSNPHCPNLLILPAVRRPFFPGSVIPMTIYNPKLSHALLAMQHANLPQYAGVFLEKPGHVENTRTVDDYYNIGSCAYIDSIYRVDNERVNLGLVAKQRIKITSLNDAGPPLRANVDYLIEQEFDPDNKIIKACSNEILVALKEIVKINPLFKEHIRFFGNRLDLENPYKLADFTASVTTAKEGELQDVMDEMDCEKRLRLALELITKELDLSKLQQDIKEQVEEKVTKNQRKYLLMENLKVIKQELGLEKDDKEALLSKYRERVEGIELPQEAQKVFDEEMEKLQVLEKNSSEFNVTRSYLDWLTMMPWSKGTTENFDVNKARVILDEDHYGLQEIKERILEFIAVSQLKATVQGKILCLVGPPGTGKTSIGKSVARALNREFYRFSVGGLTDVAEIKGHRR